MAFDPEKVVRYQRAMAMDSLTMPRVDVVKASDYDRLLVLYRQVTAPSSDPWFIWRNPMMNLSGRK